MPTDQSPADPYDLVLADLRAKRDEIDHMIAQIEKFRAGIPLAGVVQASAVTPSTGTTATTVEAGAFHGMTIPEAAKKAMTIRNRQMSNAEIVADFKVGGLVMQSADPVNTVGSVLTRRFKDVGDIVRTGRGMWGLREWTPHIRYRPKSADAEGREDDAATPKGEVEDVMS